MRVERSRLSRAASEARAWGRRHRIDRALRQVIGSGSLVKWLRLRRGIRRVPRVLKGCDDGAQWSDLVLEKAEQTTHEVAWADRADNFVRGPDGPEEPDWEVTTENRDDGFASALLGALGHRLPRVRFVWGTVAHS